MTTESSPPEHKTDIHSPINEEVKSSEEFAPLDLGEALDPDALFEQWAQEDQFMEEGDYSPSFSVGRHPLLLFLIILISSALGYYCYPALDAVIHKDHFEVCGDVFERAQSKRKGEVVTPLRHQQKCELSVMVGTINIFAIGSAEQNTQQDRFEKNRGISYVVKLHGDQIYGILPAHLKWVESYRLEHGSLFGLEFIARGLMIDPKQASGYQHLEREIRVNLAVPSDKQIWFFDLTYSPWDYLMQVITAILAPLIALLSLIALRKELSRRKHEQEAEQADEAWLQAFQDAAQQAKQQRSDLND